MRLTFDYFILSVSLCVALTSGHPTHLVTSHHAGPRHTSRDWRGIRPPVDAAMVGRVFLGPKPTAPPPTRKRSNHRRRSSRKNKQRGRQSRFTYFYDLWDYDDFFNGDYYTDGATQQQQQQQSTPVQNVYFFMKGMDKIL